LAVHFHLVNQPVAEQAVVPEFDPQSSAHRDWFRQTASQAVADGHGWLRIQTVRFLQRSSDQVEAWVGKQGWKLEQAILLSRADGFDAPAIVCN
jgi:hypothetical protein